MMGAIMSLKGMKPYRIDSSAYHLIKLITNRLWKLLVAFFLVVEIVSCRDLRRDTVEDDLSAFGPYESLLDTTLLNACLLRELDNDTAKWHSDKTVREWYREHPVSIWYTSKGISSDADSMLSYLRRELVLNGLDTTAFYIPQITANLNIVHQLAFDSVNRSINEVLPQLDYLLSKAFVRFVTGQRYGFTRPNKYLNHLDHKPLSKNPNDFSQLFDYEIKSPEYDEALRALKSEERIDFLYASKPNGHVYEALCKKMSQTTDVAERTKIAVNMERCRWQISHPSRDERCIIVNIPAQQLWAFCPDSVVPMRICCGSTSHKTPLLYSEISYMQVNPEWVIPLNIIKAEVSAHAGDSAYFARNDYSIVDKESGDTLDVKSVDCEDMESGRLRVVQKCGAHNSLGRLVFRFQNNFAIYLHDTNNHNAFNRDRRTVSHGCVRVQKPFELACFLLPDADEWELEQLRISIDIPPVTKRGKEYLKKHSDAPRPHRLISYHGVSPKIPLYIIYFTMYPNPENGEIESWNDLYGYDTVIGKEMKSLLR